MTNEKTIKKLLDVVESKHPEISIYRDAKELKERYVKGEFENDIEILRDFGNNALFFNEDGNFPEAKLYILYTTCSGDDTIYTNISQFIKNHKNIIDCQDRNVLNIIDKLINNYDLDEDEQEYLHETLKDKIKETTMTRKERKEKLQDLLLILKKFYGNEDSVKYMLKNYSNVDQPKKIEEGINIAIEMLYDKMNEGVFLNDIAQMIKDHFTAEDFIFNGAQIVLNKFDSDGTMIFSSTYEVTKVNNEDVFDLIDPTGSVSELALPAEDEYTIYDGKLYIDATFGSLEIYPF